MLFHPTEKKPAHSFSGGIISMNLNLPKKNTFWAAVIITAIGWLVYVVHLIAQFIIHVQILHLQMIAFVLVSIAFVLLCAGLLYKNF
jgi:hypothetical protein